MNAFIAEINSISTQLTLMLHRELDELRAQAADANLGGMQRVQENITRLQGKLQGLEIARVVAERLERDAAAEAVEAAIWNADPSVPESEKFHA